MSLQQAKKWYQTAIVKALAVVLVIIVLAIAVFGYLVYKAFVNLQDNPERVTTVNQFDLSEPMQEVQDIVVIDGNPEMGPSDALITVVEFSDFRCPYCQQLHPTIRRLSLEYKDSVRFIFRDYPLIGDDSRILALAGRCAHEQGLFFPFHDRIYGNALPVEIKDLVSLAEGIGINGTQFQSCVNAQRYQPQIDKDLNDASLVGVTGTPTLFINGHRIPGAPPYSVLKTILDTTLQSNSNK